MTQAQSNVMEFELMIGNDYQSFRIELDAQTLSGTETLLIDRYGGGFMNWVNRWSSEQPNGTDIVLLGFLAMRRKQIAEHGEAKVEWEKFADDVKPFSLRVSGEPSAPVANRTEKRRAARSGSPAKRAAS